MKSRGFFLGILGLAVVCLIAGSLAYFSLTRARTNILRPLVLIHNPLNHEQLPVGQGIIVQATARAQGGISRIELWVDGALVNAKEQPAGNSISPMVLSANWEAETVGSHVILVRAFSADGVEGQASLALEAVAAAVTQKYIVKEGETLESIAAGIGVGTDELAAMNPAASTGGVTAGDTLVIPGGTGGNPEADTGDGGTAPAASASPADPPVPDDSSPDSAENIAEGLGLPEGMRFRAAGIPRSLRIEVLSLHSAGAFEGLHCYVGLGDNLPRWLPDADGDPTTNESFAALGRGDWEVAGQLSGSAAPVVQWRSDQSIPIDIACVGLAGGGLEAIELGRVALSIGPEAWDGITRTAESSGAEGIFRIEYRIGPADPAPHGIPIGLDPSMTPPTDLVFQPRAFGLYWQYRPRADEAPIDGFRVYLNNTLLWTEPANARLTNLPYEWLYPPCGESYTFTVTAYRQGFPDGPESPPSNPVSREADPEHCQREMVVTFLTLTTHDLGDDGNWENRIAGDVGPAYGYFYANSQQASFDGHDDTWGNLGLSSNDQVEINSLTDSANWRGSGPARFRVEMVEGESLVLGYHITDGDTDNPDDPICDGEVFFLPGDLNIAHDGTIASRDGRCEVSYTFYPAQTNPVVEPGGGIPLPFLGVQTLDTQDGYVHLAVTNTGTASWPNRALKISYTRPTGELLSTISYEPFNLAPGATVDLRSQQSANEMGLPVCVTLDPDNEVAEIGESTGAYAHSPVCMTFPDLIVTDSRYNSDTEQLQVTVRNIGENILMDRALHVGLRLADGTLASEGVEAVSLERFDTTVVTLPAGEVRGRMLVNGYSVVADEGNHIPESNEENNAYRVPGQTQMRVKWIAFKGPYDYEDAILYFDVYVGSAGSGPTRHLGEWVMPTDGNWSGVDSTGDFPERWVQSSDDGRFDTGWFDINGDEQLSIVATVRASRSTEPSTGRDIFTVDNRYGSGPWDLRQSCWDLIRRPYGSGSGRYLWYFYPDMRGLPLPWTVSFNICRQEDE